MKFTREDIKEAFKGRKKKKAKLKKALDKIEPKKIDEKQTQTIRRHIKGLIDVVGELDRGVHSYTPKCEKCYIEHGWITKCECKNRKG